MRGKEALTSSSFLRFYHSEVSSLASRRDSDFGSLNNKLRYSGEGMLAAVANDPTSQGFDAQEARPSVLQSPRAFGPLPGRLPPGGDSGIQAPSLGKTIFGTFAPERKSLRDYTVH